MHVQSASVAAVYTRSLKKPSDDQDLRLLEPVNMSFPTGLLVVPEPWSQSGNVLSQMSMLRRRSSSTSLPTMRGLEAL